MSAIGGKADMDFAAGHVIDRAIEAFAAEPNALEN
jgi:hypothetical protein